MIGKECRRPTLIHGRFRAGGYPRTVRRPVLSLLVASALAAYVAAGASGSSQKPVTATFIGDSVAASISYVPVAQAQLKRGIRAQLDLKVCRRLVAPSCPYQGAVPSTALQAVQAYGRSLGDVLIVKVGYNDDSAGYGAGIDRVMRAARADGAHGVVWVTLRETRSVYTSTNAVIRAAAKRWPQLIVADWNAYSYGKPWFGTDGLHLSATGATELAKFLRPYVFKANTLR